MPSKITLTVTLVAAALSVFSSSASAVPHNGAYADSLSARSSNSECKKYISKYNHGHNVYQVNENKLIDLSDSTVDLNLLSSNGKSVKKTWHNVPAHCVSYIKHYKGGHNVVVSNENKLVDLSGLDVTGRILKRSQDTYSSNANKLIDASELTAILGALSKRSDNENSLIDISELTAMIDILTKRHAPVYASHLHARDIAEDVYRRQFANEDCTCVKNPLTGSSGAGASGSGSIGLGSDGLGASGSGSIGLGGDDDNDGSDGTSGTGATGSGSIGTGSDGTGATGSGSIGSGSTGTGSDGTGSSGTGATGSGSIGTGSDGTGATGSGSIGSGSDDGGSCSSGNGGNTGGNGGNTGGNGGNTGGNGGNTGGNGGSGSGTSKDPATSTRKHHKTTHTASATSTKKHHKTTHTATSTKIRTKTSSKPSTKTSSKASTKTSTKTSTKSAAQPTTTSTTPTTITCKSNQVFVPKGGAVCNTNKNSLIDLSNITIEIDVLSGLLGGGKETETVPATSGCPSDSGCCVSKSTYDNAGSNSNTIIDGSGLDLGLGIL